MIQATFDYAAFYLALDGVRSKRGVKWHRVFAETGISYGTIYNVRDQRRSISTKSLVTLATWAEIGIEQFIKGASI